MIRRENNIRGIGRFYGEEICLEGLGAVGAKPPYLTFSVFFGQLVQSELVSH